MKTLAAFVLLVIGVSAVPFTSILREKLNNKNLVEDAVANAIAELSQDIKDLGLDPLYIQHRTDSFALPVPVIFNAESVIEELLLTGLSNIVTNELNYDATALRLSFDLEIPRIQLTVNRAAAQAEIFGTIVKASVGGSFAIVRVHLAGDVTVGINAITGIVVDNMNLNFSIQEVESDLKVNILGTDYSDDVNYYLSTTVPNALAEFADEVNEFLEILATDFANSIL